MKGTSFKEVNTVFGAGGNIDTDQLPIAVSTCKMSDGQDHVFLISKWKLSEDEIKHIMSTGELWIGIMGQQMPPIMPTVWNPFLMHGFTPVEL